MKRTTKKFSNERITKQHERIQQVNGLLHFVRLEIPQPLLRRKG
jgi:hypothetical protein